MKRLMVIFLVISILLTSVVYAGLDAKDGKVISVATPTVATDATNKLYVDTKFGITPNRTEFDENGKMTMYGDARVARHLVIGGASWKIGAGAPTASFEDIYPTLLFADGRDLSLIHI